MAHPFSDFEKYIDTPLQKFIIPIIPAKNADGTPTTLRPTSNLSQDNLGKIPGLWYDDGWTGFGAWQNHRSTASNLKVWQGWQPKIGVAIPVGFITADVHAADIDSDVQEIVNAHVALLNKHLGTSMVVRCRDGSTRCVLFYKHEDHTAPIRKYRVAWIDKEEGKHAVEILAGGQQVVAEGPHAKGAMHFWQHGIGLIEGYDQLPVVNIEMINAWEEAAKQWVRDQGSTLEKGSLSSRSDRAAAVSITNLMSPHRARDEDMLAKAIKAIDINDPKLASYDTWCPLFRAMWAACGGDRDFYADHILPWLLGNPANKEEELEAKLASFTDSQLGAEHVYGWAQSFGFSEGAVSIVEDMFNGVSNNTPDDGGAPGAAGAGGATPPGGAVPPGGPIPFNDTHSAIADAFEAVFAADRRYLVDLKEWFGFAPEGVWEPRHALLHDIETVAKGVAQEILRTVNGPDGVKRNRALLSTGTPTSVRTLLQSRPAMITKTDTFDADPRLLNTPGFIINLETGETHEHCPHFMMRQQTLVTPDLVCYGSSYRLGCPRFMDFLEIIADGRSWVIPFLQRWFGYCLTGKIGHQHFLFLQGLPGTGKSQLITILVKLMHTYATMLREGFMTKGPEKRFDMVKIVGKRLGFNDETMLGSTWDETRMSNVSGSEQLSCEVKGGKEFDFPNHIKLIVAGNHRPNFVSGEAGGLLRRMLLLEMTNKPVTQTLKVEENFALRLVEEEGEAILMWAIEGAMLDYADKDSTIFNGLKAPMVEAAKAYTRENSPYWGWMDEHCTRGPEEDIDLLEAYRHFQDHVWNTTHERCRVRRTDFKAALKAMLPEIEFDTRTKGQFKGRAYIIGLGFRKIDFAEMENVVPLTGPNHNPNTAGEQAEDVNL